MSSLRRSSSNPVHRPSIPSKPMPATPRQAVLSLCLLATTVLSAVAQEPIPGPGLNYELEFVERESHDLPALQSYAFAAGRSGKWLIVGGRQQGLHGFSSSTSSGNFTAFSSHLYVIDPATGQSKRLNIDGLPASMRDPLRVTNPQQWYDSDTDTLYIVGGYGIDTSGKEDRKTTFGTITAIPVSGMIEAVTAGDLRAAQLLIRQASDPRFAVTGGGLERLGSRFLLTFGQYFDGEFVFDAPELPYVQVYTEAVRIFTLNEDTLRIELYGEVTSTASDRPFHRRDLNVLADIDPRTAERRVAVFGGVFRPGALAGYPEPIYIDRTNTVTVERTFQQTANHYECMVVPVYSKEAGTMSRTFIGGITSEHLTAARAAHQPGGGPSDGMPWVNTVTRVAYTPSNSKPYAEYDMGHTPGNRFMGGDGHFIPAASAFQQGIVDSHGIVHLDRVLAPGRVLVGHLYGGLEAEAPQGSTKSTRALFDVYIHPHGVRAVSTR